MREVIAIAIATAISSSAMAADLAVRAPVVAAAPAYNWTSIYVGVNAGYMWGQQDPFNVLTNRFDDFSTNISGGAFGATVGAQIQVAHVVLGFEADLDWANVKGSAVATPTIFGTPLPFALSLDTKIPWISTYRSRIGYAQNNWLFYVTAGAAIMGNETDLSSIGGLPCGTFIAALGFPGGPGGALNCNGTKKRIGGAFGAGTEVALNQAWSVKAEYLYVAAASLEQSKANEVRVGLNYHFGGF
jgi:outer membrane immunogenic protein